MTSIGKSIITIKRDDNNNIPDQTVDNGDKVFNIELGQKQDGKLSGVWDLTTLFRTVDKNSDKSKPYTFLSLDLHKLIRIYGQYDRDNTINKETGLRALFSSQNNTIAEMIGSRVHLVKPGKVRINISCEGDDDWRPADSITIILNITLPILKHIDTDNKNRAYNFYLRNPTNLGTEYLLTNFLTNSEGDYSLSVDDFISFFSDNNNLKIIKQSSADFGLVENDIYVWNDNTTYYDKRLMLVKLLFGNSVLASNSDSEINYTSNRFTWKPVDNTDTGNNAAVILPKVKIERANKIIKTYSRGNESLHLRAILNSKLDKDLLIRYKVTQGVNFINTYDAVIKANTRYVDIYYVTDEKYVGQEISISLEKYLKPITGTKYYSFLKTNIIYGHKPIDSNVSFIKVSHNSLLVGKNIINTQLSKGFVFSFSIEENNDFSYIVIDYPHLKIDTTKIRLETFDSSNFQYIPVTTLTSNFRSYKRIGPTRINRVCLKVLSHNKNGKWKLHFDALLTRLKGDFIELLQIQLKNSKFDNFIPKNIYSRKEIKNLKERYQEMVWKKGLLENGIQYEIRLKRNTDTSKPEVKKLIQIGVDKETNELSIVKSRNDMLYRTNQHLVENRYYKSDAYKDHYKKLPTNTARDNMFYNFYEDARRIDREKSNKYVFNNLIPGWEYAKVKEIYLRIKYFLKENEQLRTVSNFSDKTISFLKSGTQHERLSMQYKHNDDNKTNSYRIKVSNQTKSESEIYNISSNIEVSEPSTESNSWITMSKEQIINTFPLKVFNVTFDPTQPDPTIVETATEPAIDYKNYQIKFYFDDNMNLKLDYRNETQYGPGWFSYSYEEKELVPTTSSSGVDTNNFKLKVNFKSIIHAPNKTIQSIVDNEAKKIQSYCIIEMRKNNDKIEYRFAYHIPSNLKPIYFIIPLDKPNNTKSNMKSKVWSDMSIEQIGHLISIKGSLIKLTKENDSNSEKELQLLSNSDDMADLRFKIRSSSQKQWSDIYTQMPIMKECFKLQQTSKGKITKSITKNNTSIGGTETIKISLDQENIIKVHAKLDSDNNPYPVYGIGILSTVTDSTQKIKGTYSVYGSNDDNHYDIIPFDTNKNIDKYIIDNLMKNIRDSKRDYEKLVSKRGNFRILYNTADGITQDDINNFKQKWEEKEKADVAAKKKKKPAPVPEDDKIRKALQSAANQFKEARDLIINKKKKLKITKGLCATPLLKVHRNLEIDYNNFYNETKPWTKIITDKVKEERRIAGDTLYYSKLSKFFYKTQRYYRYYKIVFKKTDNPGKFANLQIDLLENSEECLFSVGSHRLLNSDNYLKGLHITRHPKLNFVKKNNPKYLNLSIFSKDEDVAEQAKKPVSNEFETRVRDGDWKFVLDDFIKLGFLNKGESFTVNDKEYKNYKMKEIKMINFNKIVYNNYFNYKSDFKKILKNENTELKEYTTHKISTYQTKYLNAFYLMYYVPYTQATSLSTIAQLNKDITEGNFKIGHNAILHEALTGAMKGWYGTSKTRTVWYEDLSSTEEKVPIFNLWKKGMGYPIVLGNNDGPHIASEKKDVERYSKAGFSGGLFWKDVYIKSNDVVGIKYLDINWYEECKNVLDKTYMTIHFIKDNKILPILHTQLGIKYTVKTKMVEDTSTLFGSEKELKYLESRIPIVEYCVKAIENRADKNTQVLPHFNSIMIQFHHSDPSLTEYPELAVHNMELKIGEIINITKKLMPTEMQDKLGSNDLLENKLYYPLILKKGISGKKIIVGIKTFQKYTPGFLFGGTWETKREPIYGYWMEYCEIAKDLYVIEQSPSISYITKIKLGVHSWIFDKDVSFEDGSIIDLKLLYRQFLDDKTKAKLHEYYMFYRKNYKPDDIYFHPVTSDTDIPQYNKWLYSSNSRKADKWIDSHTTSFWKEIDRYAYQNNKDSYPKGIVDKSSRWTYLGKSKNNTKIIPYSNTGSLYLEHFGKHEKYYRKWFSQNPSQSVILDMCIRMGWINPILSKKDVIQGADLSNKTILNLDLRKRYLKGVKMNNTALFNINFQGCELANASLFNTYLEKVNFTGASLSGVNFTAIHYDNKRRPIQLSHIELESTKVDGANLNGLAFDVTENKNDKLVNTIYHTPKLNDTGNKNNMFSCYFWPEANELPLGIAIRKLMCDELTIFSYNESVFQNILNVFLIKDITSPDNRITPVTLSGYNLKGYPIYKPISVSTTFPWMTKYGKTRCMDRLEKVGRCEWRLYGGYQGYSPEYVPIFETKFNYFPTNILIENTYCMVTANYAPFKGYEKWVSYGPDDYGKVGVWWNVRGLLLSDFFTVKSGLINDIKTWRYGKMPINGKDLDDDIYQYSNYQKIIYLAETVEIPTTYTWDHYGITYVFGTLVNHGVINNYGVIHNLNQIVNKGTINNCYSDKIPKEIQKSGGILCNGPNFAANISTVTNLGIIRNNERCFVLSKHPSKFYNRKLIQNYGVINVNGEFMCSQKDLNIGVKTGLILNEGFVNYNKNKLIQFTPNVDIVERGYGKTLMYDYIYQGANGEDAHMTLTNRLKKSNNYNFKKYKASRGTLTPGQAKNRNYSIRFAHNGLLESYNHAEMLTCDLRSHSGNINKIFGDDVINNSNTTTLPFVKDNSNILYDIPYKDFKIGGGAEHHSFTGFQGSDHYVDKVGKEGNIVLTLRGTGFTNDSRNRGYVVAGNSKSTYLDWFSGGCINEALKDNNNNVYVYGDLSWWGNINLVGENSYLYNSGKIMDSRLAGDDAYYYKTQGYSNERLPQSGPNFTYGNVKWYTKEKLMNIGRDPDHYHKDITDQDKLADGSFKQSQRNKIYVGEDGLNITSAHGSGYSCGEKVQILKDAKNTTDWIDAWVLSTLPLSVSLHEIPAGTKLPFYTSDIEYITTSWKDYGKIKRYYVGNIFTEVDHNPDHNPDIQNSTYQSTGFGVYEFKIWTGNNGQGLLTADIGTSSESTFIYDKANKRYTKANHDGYYTASRNKVDLNLISNWTRSNQTRNNWELYTFIYQDSSSKRTFECERRFTGLTDNKWGKIHKLRKHPHYVYEHSKQGVKGSWFNLQYRNGEIIAQYTGRSIQVGVRGKSKTDVGAYRYQKWNYTNDQDPRNIDACRVKFVESNNNISMKMTTPSVDANSKSVVEHVNETELNGLLNNTKGIIQMQLKIGLIVDISEITISSTSASASTPDTTTPSNNYITESNNSYSFNVANIINADISHIKIVWPKTENEWGTEYIVFQKSTNKIYYATQTDLLNTSTWKVEINFNAVSNKYEDEAKEYKLSLLYNKANNSFQIQVNTFKTQIPDFFKSDGTKHSEIKLTTPTTAEKISNQSNNRNLIPANQISAESDNSKIIFKLTNNELSTNAKINYDFVYDRNSNYKIQIKQIPNVQSTSTITMKYEMSSSIRDAQNKTSVSYVKLSGKDTNNLYLHQFLKLSENTSTIAFTADETFKFDETITTDGFKKVFKKHRGVICYPELGRTVISDFNTAYYAAYYAAMKHDLSEIRRKLYLYVINDTYLYNKYNKSELEMMASYSDNFVNEKGEDLSPTYDINNEYLYQITKEYVISYCETKFRLETDNSSHKIKKIGSNEYFTKSDTTEFLKEMYIYYFVNDDNTKSTGQQSISYATIKLSQPNKTQQYYNTFVYITTTLKVSEEKALQICSNIKNEPSIKTQKMYQNKLAEGFVIFHDMKNNTLESYDRSMKAVLGDIRNSISLGEIDFNYVDYMLNKFSITNIGAYYKYFHYYTKTQLITKTYLPTYSLYYALADSFIIKNINNPKKNHFYSSGYAEKKQNILINQAGEYSVVSNEQADLAGKAKVEGYTTYSDLYKNRVNIASNLSFCDPYNYLSNIITLTSFNTTTKHFILVKHQNPNITIPTEYRNALFNYDLDIAVEADNEANAGQIVNEIYKKITDSVSPSTLLNLYSNNGGNSKRLSGKIAIYPPLIRINNDTYFKSAQPLNSDVVNNSWIHPSDLSLIKADKEAVTKHPYYMNKTDAFTKGVQYIYIFPFKDYKPIKTDAEREYGQELLYNNFEKRFTKENIARISDSFMIKRLFIPLNNTTSEKAIAKDYINWCLQKNPWISDTRLTSEYGVVKLLIQSEDQKFKISDSSDNYYDNFYYLPSAINASLSDDLGLKPLAREICNRGSLYFKHRVYKESVEIKIKGGLEFTIVVDQEHGSGENPELILSKDAKFPGGWHKLTGKNDLQFIDREYTLSNLPTDLVNKTYYRGPVSPLAMTLSIKTANKIFILMSLGNGDKIKKNITITPKLTETTYPEMGTGSYSSTKGFVMITSQYKKDEAFKDNYLNYVYSDIGPDSDKTKTGVYVRSESYLDTMNKKLENDWLKLVKVEDVNREIDGVTYVYKYHFKVWNSDKRLILLGPTTTPKSETNMITILDKTWSLVNNFDINNRIAPAVIIGNNPGDNIFLKNCYMLIFQRNKNLQLKTEHKFLIDNYFDDIISVTNSTEAENIIKGLYDKIKTLPVTVFNKYLRGNDPIDPSTQKTVIYSPRFKINNEEKIFAPLIHNQQKWEEYTVGDLVDINSHPNSHPTNIQETELSGDNLTKNHVMVFKFPDVNNLNATQLARLIQLLKIVQVDEKSLGSESPALGTVHDNYGPITIPNTSLNRISDMPWRPKPSETFAYVKHTDNQGVLREPPNLLTGNYTGLWYGIKPYGVVQSKAEPPTLGDVSYFIIGGSLTKNEYVKSFVVYYTTEVDEMKRSLDWKYNVNNYKEQTNNDNIWKISQLKPNVTSSDDEITKNITYHTGLNELNRGDPFTSLPVVYLYHTIEKATEIRLVITEYVGHPTIRITPKYPYYLYDISYLNNYLDMKTIHLDKEPTKLPEMLISLKPSLINEQIITSKKLQLSPEHTESIYQSDEAFQNTLTKKTNYYSRVIDYILYKNMSRYYAMRYMEYYLTLKRLHTTQVSDLTIHKEARYYGLTREFLTDSDYYIKLYERLIKGVPGWGAQNKPITSSLVYHLYRLKKLNNIPLEDFRRKDITIAGRSGIIIGLQVASINGSEVTLTNNPENYLKLYRGMELKINNLTMGIIKDPPVQVIKSRNNKLTLTSVSLVNQERIKQFTMPIDCVFHWKAEPQTHTVKLEPINNQVAIFDANWSKTTPDIIDWNGKSIHLMKSDFGDKLGTDGKGDTPTYNTLSLAELKNALSNFSEEERNKYISELDTEEAKRATDSQSTREESPNEKWYSVFRPISDPTQYQTLSQYVMFPNIKDLDHIERTLYYKITNCPTVFDSQNGIYRYIGKLKYSYTRSGIQRSEKDGIVNIVEDTSIVVDRKNPYYIRKDNVHPFAAETQTSDNYDYKNFYHVWINCDGNGSVLVYHPSGSNQWGLPYESVISRYPDINVVNKNRLTYSKDKDWRLNNGLWQIYGNHGYTEDHKIVRTSWHEVTGTNTDGWKGGSFNINVNISGKPNLVGKLITAKGYRQDSIAAKIKDGTIVTKVQYNSGTATAVITVNKKLTEQSLLPPGGQIILTFISTSMITQNPSNSVLSGRGYQANILKNNSPDDTFFNKAENVLLLKLDYPSFIKGRTYIPAHNICGFIFGSGKDDSGNEDPSKYVTKIEYTIIDIITNTEHKGTLETGLSATKSYSEVFFPRDPIIRLGRGGVPLPPPYPLTPGTYSTDEVKLIIKEYIGKPVIKVGVMYDFIKNTLNDKHSFDFEDKKKLHWDVNKKLDTCMDTLYGVEPVGRENALDWITSPHIEKYVPTEFSKERGVFKTNPIDLGEIKSSITFNANFTEELYTLNEKTTYYLQFILKNDYTNGYIEISEQFIKNADNKFIPRSEITAKIELLDSDGSTLKAYQENLDYTTKVKLEQSLKQLNTRIMWGETEKIRELNKNEEPDYITKLNKDKKYYLKITNLKVNPGQYKIEINVPQVAAIKSVTQEEQPLFLEKTTINGTDYYKFKLKEIVEAGYAYMELDWKKPAWGKEYLIFRKTDDGKGTTDPSNPSLPYQLIWSANNTYDAGGAYSTYTSYNITDQKTEYDGQYKISIVKSDSSYKMIYGENSVTITHFKKIDGTQEDIGVTKKVGATPIYITQKTEENNVKKVYYHFNQASIFDKINTNDYIYIKLDWNTSNPNPGWGNEFIVFKKEEGGNKMYYSTNKDSTGWKVECKFVNILLDEDGKKTYPYTAGDYKVSLIYDTDDKSFKIKVDNHSVVITDFMTSENNRLSSINATE